MQATQLSIPEAIDEAPRQSERLIQLASEHRACHDQHNAHNTIALWEPCARTFCYQTHIAIESLSTGTLQWLADVFYNAATLATQPWYTQFLGGQARDLAEPPAEGIDKHQLALGRFDLGLHEPRCYRQLVSLASPDAATRVVVARSVEDGPKLPDKTRLAYTLNPNGEVLFLEDGYLHWHHICCTPGAGLLPQPLDRWLINALRRLGLDQAERKTYQDEAERLRDWVTSRH